MSKKIFLSVVAVLMSGMMLQAEDVSQSSNQSQEFQGFNLTGYTDAGQKKWDVQGDRADILGDVVKLTNIVAKAYGEEQVNLTAQEGVLNKVTGKMHLEKDVVITAQNGARLTTDSLDWDREKDLVTTPDEVMIVKEGMTATGTGAVAHPNLNTAQMNEDVTVTMNTEPKEPDGKIVTITCDGPLEIDYTKQMAIFNDNVVAIETDKKLLADKIEVFFDAQAKQIKEMICTGHVSIIHGENTTYSEKAIYKAGEQKLTLIGQPKLILYMESDGGSMPFDALTAGTTETTENTKTPSVEESFSH